MDLRSIINSDTSSATQTPRAQPLQPSPVKQNAIEPHQGYHGTYVSPASNHGGYQHRPAPPPPLQPPGPNDFRSPGGSSSYHSAQSPYQQTPSSSLSGGQYPFPHPSQSPAQGPNPQAYPQRDSYPSITPTSYHSQQLHGHPSQSPYTPSTTTPGGSHSYPQHYTSHSSHSSPTPSSAHSQGAYTHRESPLSASHQNFPQPQRLQHSQPGTPLGPPLERQRPSTGVHREEPMLHNNHHHESPIAPSYPQLGSTSPSQIFPKGPATSEISQTKYGHMQPMLSDRERDVREYLIERDRERSLSVSPKTKLPSQPRQETIEKRHSGQEAWSGQVTPAKRKAEENSPFEGHPKYNGNEASLKDIITAQDDSNVRPTMSKILPGHQSVHNGSVTRRSDTDHPTNGEDKEIHSTFWPEEQPRTTTLSPASYSNTAQQLLIKSPSRPSSKGRLMPSPMTPVNRPSTSPQPPINRPSPTLQVSTNTATALPASLSSDTSSAPISRGRDARPKRNLDVALGSGELDQQQSKKKRRKNEVPIWAQCVIPGRWNSYTPQNLPSIKQDSTRKEIAKRESQDAQGSRTVAAAPESRKSTPSKANNAMALPMTHPDLGDNGPLGPWEPSITNTIPYEELTRGIADFLMHQVVQRDDVAAGGAGAVSGQEAVLEIEAKIGQLINSSTDERLVLPIRSECIVDSSHPNLRTNFRSSMTESQHRNFNQFLNEATRASKLLDAPPGSAQALPSGSQSKARIPMTYKHRRERDSFHALPQSAHSAIPTLIREHPSIQKHGVRVRVSHDQVTGKEIAKIIKVRIADLEIYSPLTAFDWRVSVSLEMKYEGPVGAAASDPDRNKDRMSYHHLAYDMDLTQVTTVPNSGSKPTKEHELEVEVDAAEVRKQGRLAIAGQPHQYEDLVRGFVDNVRLLARAGSTLRA